MIFWAIVCLLVVSGTIGILSAVRTTRADWREMDSWGDTIREAAAELDRFRSMTIAEFVEWRLAEDARLRREKYAVRKGGGPTNA